MFGKFRGLWLLALASVFVLASCEKDETTNIAGVQLTVSTAVVTASATGGSYSFTYSVAGSVDGGSVSCSANVDWLTDIDCSSVRTVRLAVDENTAGESREGVLTLVHTSSGGSVSATVIVAQNASGTPELEVNPVAVTASVEGGTYEFAYTLVNPPLDGELTCEANADWVGSFDCSAEGSVRFNVEENYETELRTCEITATYSYGGGSVSAVVTLVQNHTGGGLSVSDLIGVYEATGTTLNPDYFAGESSEMFVEKTWTLTIYENYAPTVVIDGLLPESAGYYYPDEEEPMEAYIAEAFLDSYGRLIVPSQFSGYAMSVAGSTLYIGYTPCTDFDGTNIYMDVTGPDCVFTYNSATKTWTSDYGLVLGLFTSYSFSTMYAYSDVAVPTISMKKADASPEALSSARAKTLPAEMEMYMNFRCE
ncbi:MAG: hypothetical protein LUD72_02555 [Bacteroidales bacterium]|nr:hypothetical protein [Bacteroidales bacterium]